MSALVEVDEIQCLKDAGYTSEEIEEFFKDRNIEDIKSFCEREISKNLN